MTRISQLRHISLSVALAALMAAPVPAHAQRGGDVSDLVGARAAGGETELEARGYTFITGSEGMSAKYAYWWHPGSKRCVRVETRDGRYASLTGTSAGDCHQRSGGNAAGAATAVGTIAAVAAIAAIASHKSHHHDNGSHYGAYQDEHQYERGYNDGLYKNDYHNYDRSDAYSSGYSAGVSQRRANSAYHLGGSGYRPAAAYADLSGHHHGHAHERMLSRGFGNVDRFSSGSTSYGIYYNPRTGQCVQSTMADDRVLDIRDIGSHPRCR